MVPVAATADGERIVELEKELEALRAELDAEVQRILGGFTAVCVFCGVMYAATSEPERVEHVRAHMLDCERHPVHEIVAAWRTATGCDSPGQAEQLARDAVVVREGHWDALLAERERWKSATGCDSPEEAGEVVRALGYVSRALDRAVSRCPADELARLRELERTVLEHRQACEEESGPVAADDTDEQMHARIERLNRLGAAEDAAIAACRAAREGK